MRAANTPGHRVGEIIALPLGAVVLGGHALCDDPATPGSTIHVIRVDPPAEAAKLASGIAELNMTPDARVCSIRYGVDGVRYRDFREAIPLMEVSQFTDFPLTGPRSAHWLMTTIAQTSSGPLARHSRWTAESGVSMTDRSRYEHEILSRILETAVTYDCLNVTNLACLEIAGRRLQLLEESHLEDPLHPSFEGARHFVGTGERRGGALIAPSLQAHVATQLAGEAAIAKERRKALEVKGLPGGGGGGRCGGRGGRDGGRGGRGAAGDP